MKKKALIFGITGQDGPILSSILLAKNYEVHGISRKKNYKNLDKLRIKKKINKYLIKNNNEKKIINILKKNFEEIYFLGGQSSVNESFNLIEETFDSQIRPVKIILNYIYNQKKKKTKFLYAASSEIFGQKKNKKKLTEKDTKEPISPYALSKLISYEIIREYRNTHKLPVCSAILFNHESNLRDKNYVLKKIVNAIKDIKLNKKKKIKLGNINIKRDWGWAEDFMTACNLILSKNKIDDYIIATGRTTSLKKILQKTLKNQKYSWQNYINIDKNLFRKFDIKENYANISKIKKNLNWRPKHFIKDLIYKI